VNDYPVAAATVEIVVGVATFNRLFFSTFNRLFFVAFNRRCGD
jgi:hypothetical protein